MVSSYTQKFSKNSGKQFGILMLEDLDTTVECMLYERAIADMNKNQLTLVPRVPLLITGTVSRKDEGEMPRIVIDSISDLQRSMVDEVITAFLFVNENEMNEDLLKQIKNVLSVSPGNTQITICCTTEDKHYAFIDTGCKVNFTFDMLKNLQEILGEKNVKLRCTPFRNTPKPKRFFKKDNAAEKK